MYINQFNTPKISLMTFAPKMQANTCLREGLVADTFIKSSPAFGKRNDTSNGDFLKELKGIHDPYSGCVMISVTEMNKILLGLKKAKTPKKKLDILKPYEDSMLPLERRAYKMLSTAIMKDDNISLNDVLNSKVKIAQKNIQEKQSRVFDLIEEKSEGLSQDKREFIGRLVEQGRNNNFAINNGQNKFSKALFIKEIDEQKDVELKPIIALAQRFPTSMSDVDSFIIRYANSTDKQIVERLITPSTSTVEHIIPDSLGGKNEARNFILTSKGRNSERGDMEIEDYIGIHPDIPEHCQEYMNDIVEIANGKGLKHHKWYPYVIKDTLNDNMGIDVSISDYKVESKEAFKSIPSRLRKDYAHYIKPQKDNIGLDLLG